MYFLFILLFIEALASMNLFVIPMKHFELKMRERESEREGGRVCVYKRECIYV